MDLFSRAVDTQISQGFKCRLEKSLEWRSRNLEHTGESIEIKIAGKSSWTPAAPQSVPFLLLKSFLAPREMLWMLETCPQATTTSALSHCRCSLPSTCHQCTDGDLQHIPASRIHAPKRSLIWVYFAFSFLEVCFVLSGELGMSRAGVAMPVLAWRLQQEPREMAQGPVGGSRRGAGGSSKGSWWVLMGAPVLGAEQAHSLPACVGLALC